LLAAAGVACAATPPQRFYVLDDVVPSPPRSESADSIGTVVIDPVALPEQVDRPQLVVRTEGNRVAILEQQRWAEPLRTGIARLVATHLSRSLATNQVSTRDRVLTDPDYRVAIEVRSLEVVPGRAVSLEALWSVSTKAGQVRSGASRAAIAVTAHDHDAIVRAIAETVRVLSADLARAVRGLAG
jgi:uncharacterized lipoprotein YmbA